MDKFSLLSTLSAVGILVSACGGGSAENSLFLDGGGLNTAGQSELVTLGTPNFEGDVVFDSTQVIDLDPIIEAAGLSKTDGRFLSRDGTNVLVEVENEEGDVAAILTIDTDSAEVSWLITEMSVSTRLLTDANNNVVAVFGLGCGDVAYNVVNGPSPVNLSAVLPDGRCFGAHYGLSANGAVALFSTYPNGDGTPYLSANSRFHAYTLDTATLVDYPNAVISEGSLELDPQLAVSTYIESDLSDDGTSLISKQWWESSDETGRINRRVGAVLWNTQTGDWQPKGVMNDARDCQGSLKISCIPPYSYVQSTASKSLYVQLPTNEQINLGAGPVIEFGTTVEKSDFNEAVGLPMAGLINGQSLSVNANGSLMLFYAATETGQLTEGYTLHSPSSGQFISLNRALRSCPEVDNLGDVLDESVCDYTSIPATITSNATRFTADGSHVVFRSISRFTDELEQGVDSFLLDVNQATMFTIPDDFSVNPDAISGDGSVLLGQTGYPDYDVIIGRR